MTAEITIFSKQSENIRSSGLFRFSSWYFKNGFKFFLLEDSIFLVANQCAMAKTEPESLTNCLLFIDL